MSILINILSTFNSKGLTAAEKRTKAFNQTLKTLGGTMAATFGARRIAQFAKDSIKAFAEEDKAIRSLSLNLKNLNLAYDVTPIEDYIDKLQRATGIADDQLRPAFQQLANATRNLSKSQEILNVALDISAGSGKSVQQVTQALSRAYLGNMSSLSRLNIGISKTELTTKSFDTILEDLSKRFKGQAAEAAETYIGKMQRLNIAADEAKETLGKKLVQALDVLAGDRNGVGFLADEMERTAEAVGNVVLGLAVMAQQIEKMSGGKIKMSEALSPLNLLAGTIFTTQTPVLGALIRLAASTGGKASAESRFSVRRFTKEQLIDINKILKGQKATTTELNNQLKLQLASKALTKSGDLMDMDKIQLAAAAQGKLTEGEKLRVEYMQKRLELEDAIAAKEGTRALALANQLTSLEDRIMAFKPASPFDAWEQSILRMQNGLYNLGISEKKGSPGSLSTASPVTPEMSVFGGAAFITPELATRNPTGVTQINVTVQGTGGLDDQTKKAVVDAVVEASSYGNPTNWFRTTGKAVIAI